ncbi:YjjG family noncanonical pyrimidine nucleotidase [Ligilactobacillus sp. WILCCON 0076]|uniref:YjjG family noncanonical pyrimidine nucleotidase n=1 Tax=Ligilactobacillus ubinensis TaxID=2876789 RepID=A0A9X2FLK6_9LACO|nr:YjjG family noncanonical pyrimidine nucleotidase [Ligilactobacillus ubinensis]MCP0887861.1 YjjG family noncanonical pyrimidine nucleotidase [Ligilactobacillus ubinensis]
MVKNVIFDLDDTLLDFDRGEVEGVKAILKENGVTDIDLGFKTYLKINQNVWENIEAGADRQPLLDTRFSKTLARLGITANGQELEKKYRMMINRNFYTLAGAEQLLDKLKASGVQLIVGSNGVKQTQMQRLEGSGLIHYFNRFFISEDIGFSKPDTRFFNAILNASDDITAKNTIMVGDRLQSDILGAANTGIKSIWFNPKHNANNFSYSPDYTVDNYADILKIVL